jgi:transposase
MSDEELRHLSPDQVVVQFRRLEAALATAVARIAELEAELARRTGPPKTPANSSVPPSQGWKRKRPPAPGGKRGARPGHPGHSRARVEPDAVREYRPTHCRHCGEPLPAAPQHRLAQRQVVELPPVRPWVTEHRRFGAWCSRCHRRTKAVYPPGVDPTQVLGPRLEALTVYLHERHHLGYARLQGVYADLFGLPLSQGAIGNLLARAGERLGPRVSAIREQVRASPVIGSDETSARVHGQNHWQWVFQTPEATYMVIVPRRNADAVTTFQAGTAAETWVSDLWKPQLGAAARHHQVCLGHQLRDLQYVIDKEQSAWARACQELFRLAIHRAHQRDQGALRGVAYTAAVQKIETACDRLLTTPVPGAEASRLWVRFREQRAGLFVFLSDPRVPPTNNTSEQALRNSVVHRKVCGSFRSDWGPAVHAAVTTVLDTARKQGHPIFETLVAALTPPPPTRA